VPLYFVSNAMTRLILPLSLFIFATTFAFAAILFLSAPPASAQGFGLVQNDYNEYARLFKIGREPNLATSDRWRRAYANHRWADYADGNEHRDPMLAAEVLAGIYLTTHVDQRLNYQIQNIIMGKAGMSSALAERITLDRIRMYFDTSEDEALRARIDAAGGGNSFYSPLEVERMEYLNRDIHEAARRRIVSGPNISRAQQIEIRSIENLFNHGERGWVPMYYFMREKFQVLEALTESFTFNWDEARQEAELEKIMERPDVQREAEDRARGLVRPTSRAAADGMMDSGSSSYDSYDDYGSSSSGYDDGSYMMPPSSMSGMPSSMTPVLSEEEIQERAERERRTIAEERLKAMENRQLAYKYIVGVYEDRHYHLATLRKIHRYFESAAKQGDPVAQYHLALFLRFLGDIVDPDGAEDFQHESEEWLKQAISSDVTKRRVEELNAQLAEEVSREGRRKAAMFRKIESLVRVENEKLGLFDDVLIMVREEIQNSGSGSGGGRSGRSGGMSGGRNSSSDSGMGGSSSGRNTRSGRGSSSSSSGY
jgi:hypothetical protein